MVTEVCVAVAVPATAVGAVPQATRLEKLPIVSDKTIATMVKNKNLFMRLSFG
jgi:hypothetical protein